MWFEEERKTFPITLACQCQCLEGPHCVGTQVVQEGLLANIASLMDELSNIFDIYPFQNMRRPSKTLWVWSQTTAVDKDLNKVS